MISLTDYQTYIHLSKYARWIEEKKQREIWEETVHRYVNFFDKYLNTSEVTHYLQGELKEAILKMEVMPSMRALMTAGPALERDHIAGYNCTAIAINHPRCFDEIFYILMNGCGVGFSVERQYIAKLPDVSDEFFETGTTIVVADSKIGWASAFRELISLLYAGKIPKWDLSKVRPAGARLKTFGGRASGKVPLDKLFKFTVRTFLSSAGRKLNSLECHDLVCKIADTVIVGSVRRAACISFSNLTDDRMRRAKTGEWWITQAQRALANNSTAYTEKPDLTAFAKEWRNQYTSKSGERGIVNKEALRAKAESCSREHDGDYLLNPCGEAILRDTGQACNLTEVVIRPKDTYEDLKRKVKHATILGTIQSTLTDTRYLRPIWKKNLEEERLLGVSLTGIMDHPIMNGSQGYDVLISMLKTLHEVAYQTNKEWAKYLGINPSKQLTLVKPSGTVSQLVDSSSGIHPRMFPYYIRRVRQDKKDPLSQLMIDQGIPYTDTEDKYIFSFPIKAPEKSITSNDIRALDQLELWKVYQAYWCDGNPSQTIYYTDDEYFAIADWIWRNWDVIGGLSFFPKDDHIYENPPYEQITKEAYESLLARFPSVVDWSKLSEYEKEDGTTSTNEIACSGGSCEL
jgi:ribonucleoside-triphosphate reductase (thioredoxin)